MLARVDVSQTDTLWESSMKEWLIAISEQTIVVIDGLALIIIALGTVEAFVCGLRFALSPTSGHERRDIWLRFSRWLVAALTFQLAADIIESSITTGWEALGRLAAIALIRTFLNYFLERDLTDLREQQRAKPESSTSSKAL
jgi:uncharacterized membrane protein